MTERIFIAVVIVVSGVFSANAFGQKNLTIKLDNPSFEDKPSVAHTPKDWYNCGFENESPPDIHSGAYFFNVNTRAFRGDTYLGMVVRDNNTWEAVGQKLDKLLLKNVKYSFSLYACQSELYMSQSRETGKDANYVVPAVIKIWASDSSECGRIELLAQSQPIDFKGWKKLEFTLSPKADYQYFIIEAYYIKVLKYVYNGNVLIDNASAIVPILEKND